MTSDRLAARHQESKPPSAVAGGTSIAEMEAQLGARRGDGTSGEPVPVGAASDGGDAVRQANRRLAEHIRRSDADEGDHARAVRDLVRRLVERKLAISNPALLWAPVYCPTCTELLCAAWDGRAGLRRWVL